MYLLSGSENYTQLKACLFCMLRCMMVLSSQHYHGYAAANSASSVGSLVDLTTAGERGMCNIYRDL